MNPAARIQAVLRDHRRSQFQTVAYTRRNLSRLEQATEVKLTGIVMSIEISPERTRIGWIGAGVMGRSMCGHLFAANYKVTLFTRTKEKSDELLKQGATWAASPRDVAAASDIVISIVGYPKDVREVTLGANGALAGSKSGNILVDMTTSEPSLAVEIAQRAAERGVMSIDAPVSGGDVGARNATLSIMIGGDANTVSA